ncbi:hypothetical protein [Cellulomonas soli]|uniref:Uncharacterized protein n=1 Tax=Cellulomonas soli TaxID=931535 RepID=A0A512PHJ8_9CELL|nr:hypothetical protein [Cellulomonas soli]NYI59171.1 hypothetical protein [Cellulomonas soli]GEP70675.1 hypothetical protein CSO01_33900 [Cellulomonas soli]
MRLTKQIRQQLLVQNEGFETVTRSREKNFTENRQYRIEGGQLHVRATGQTSWADSRFDDRFIADDAQTHRFLYENLGRLNTEGLD